MRKWFDGELMGFIEGGQFYAAHNDHLGRPEAVTNQGGTVVWRANNRAFNRTVQAGNTVESNLGFPGQYHDKELEVGTVPEQVSQAKRVSNQLVG